MIGVRSSCPASSTNARWAAKAAGQPVDHRIELAGQPGYLVAADHGDAPFEICIGDRLGGGGELPDRPEEPTGDEPRHRRRHDEDPGSHSGGDTDSSTRPPRVHRGGSWRRRRRRASALHLQRHGEVSQPVPASVGSRPHLGDVTVATLIRRTSGPRATARDGVDRWCAPSAKATKTSPSRGTLRARNVSKMARTSAPKGSTGRRVDPRRPGERLQFAALLFQGIVDLAVEPIEEHGPLHDQTGERRSGRQRHERAQHTDPEADMDPAVTHRRLRRPRLVRRRRRRRR